jgi:RpiR family transcriptional regulator, carbohydrate utilization regulator
VPAAVIGLGRVFIPMDEPRSEPQEAAKQKADPALKLAIRDRVGRGQAPNVLPLLRGMLPTLKRAQRRVTEGILRDPEQLITQSISDLARTCGVSTGSIVLFCKSLGLRGFPALKIALARELAAPVLPSFGKKPEGQVGTPVVLQRVFEEHVECLHQTLKLNTGPALDDAARSLVRAKRIVLFSIGLSFPVAYALYCRLRFLGLPAAIEFDSHLQLAAAAEMKKGEVAIGISLSGSTSETVECVRISKARGVRTICITNSVDSPITRASDIRLFAAPSEVKYFQTPLSSRVCQLALADVLLALIGLQRKRQALAHLRRAEEYLLKRRVLGFQSNPHLGRKGRAVAPPDVTAHET